MNEEYFKAQLDMGQTEMFFYGVERNEGDVQLKSHKGSLDEFPTSLVYVGELSKEVPLFKNGVA